MTLQGSAAPGDAPPVGGLGAQMMFWAFLVIILVVPWLMAAAGPLRRPRPVQPAEPPAAPGQGRFTSPRERRLWLYAAAVAVAIYATLSPAQQIAAALRTRGLLGPVSGAVLLAVGLVLAVHWLRTRPGRLEIGAGIGVAAAYVATVIRLPVPEARSHLFEYGLLAMLIHQALAERRRNGRRVPVPPVLALAVTVVLGALDEVIQIALPTRVFDLVDVGLNAAFAAMAITAGLFMRWARSLDVPGRVRRRRS